MSESAGSALHTDPSPGGSAIGAARKFVVAVIGNPNTGKTTLFNALTGLTQHTGNYPGVTVESALGEFKAGGSQFLAVDLPGSYSLAPRSPDEMEAVKVLLGMANGNSRPDVVLCVVDASNLDRNLYLLTQVMDVGLPIVVALTMVDVAKRNGIQIDFPALERQLGLQIVPVHASRRRGIDDLRLALAEAAREGRRPQRMVTLPQGFEDEIGRLVSSLGCNGDAPPRFLVERFLIDKDGMIEEEMVRRFGEPARRSVTDARQRLAAAQNPLPQLEIDARYRWIGQVVESSVRLPAVHKESWTDKIDRVVTHKFFGALIFLVTTALVFQAIFTWAVPFMDLVDGLFRSVGAGVGSVLPEGALRSLILDGVIGGAGAVVVFVPQIAILFALITILEDSGYMARAAFLMDRIMAGFGLSGRSFIPLLSSFACAVPGIMAARAIENRRDRIVTILIAPLMSCSARLPVYVLFIAAFIPPVTIAGVIGLQGLTLFAMYGLGLVVAPVVAWILKRAAFRGPAVPFLLELPPYKIPSWRVVLFRMYDRSWAFIRRAGTIILATSILIWAASYYPVQEDVTRKYDQLRAGASSEDVSRLDEQEAGERLRNSYLGRAGQAIEPLIRPLGWDWKIGMATLASFPAREVIIAALGTIYNLGSGEAEDSVELRETMRSQRWPDGRRIYTPAVALSVMVFFALCCQCAATLATIKRETNSWLLPAFTFVYMTTLAYGAAFVVYQVGHRVLGE